MKRIPALTAFSATAFVALALACSGAQAGMLRFYTTQQFAKLCKVKPYRCINYVKGIADTEFYLSAQVMPPLFCLPQHANAVQMTKAVFDYYKSHPPGPANGAATPVIIQALSATYPCRNK